MRPQPDLNRVARHRTLEGMARGDADLAARAKSISDHVRAPEREILEIARAAREGDR